MSHHQWQQIKFEDQAKILFPITTLESWAERSFGNDELVEWIQGALMVMLRRWMRICGVECVGRKVNKSCLLSGLEKMNFPEELIATLQQIDPSDVIDRAIMIDYFNFYQFPPLSDDAVAVMGGILQVVFITLVDGLTETTTMEDAWNDWISQDHIPRDLIRQIAL